MDPVTTATTAAGVVKAAGAVAGEVSKTGLPTRLFGPLVDEVGTSWAEGYRRRNVEKVAAKAARRQRLEDPKVVHARVAYRVLQDGSFCNDDVMQEYLAGLVAGSYTEDGGDDRASYYVDLVARLPAAQVRLHHAIYTALATAGKSRRYGDRAWLGEHIVLAPVNSAMAVLGPIEGVGPGAAVGEAILGLARESLVSEFALDDGEKFAGYQMESKGYVLMAEPSIQGVLLALWAHGIRTANTSSLPKTVPCDFSDPGPTFDEWQFSSPQVSDALAAEPGAG